MRKILVATGLGFALCGGCAQAPVRGTTDPSKLEADPVTTRLRQDNAALRRRVQMLEDRVLKLERGADPLQAATGRDLPVVRLDPPRTEPPRGAVEPEQAPRAHAAMPRSARRSISLTPSPSSTAVGPQPEPSEPVSEAWTEDDAETAARSYRLVGSRLVDLTKTHAPTRPDRPSQDGAGKSIVAQYKEAMKVYRSGDYVEAERAFDVFARSHADHDYADNALYWKGEAAYDQRHYANALAAFTEVVERYGGGNKAPDALLKIGLCYDKLGDVANARDVLSQLVLAYPGERASDIARARIEELGG